MQHRLGKLLESIIEEIADSADVSVHNDQIRQRLADKGYKKTEIEAALRMVHAVSAPVAADPDSAERKRAAAGKPRSVYRVLSPWERAKLTADAHEELLRLDRTGLLLPEEREAVIDRAMDVEGRVDGQEIRALVAWTILPSRDINRHRILLELIDDSDPEELPVH